jgi:hypothetical protein
MSCTNAERKAAFEHVFLNQKWGNSANSGKAYQRPYKKTKTKVVQRATAVVASKGKKKK